MTFPFLPRHLSDTPDAVYLRASSPLLSSPKITSRRALSYAGELPIPVCLPAIPIKGSIVLAACGRHSRAREIVYVSTKLDGLDVEGALPPFRYSRDCCCIEHRAHIRTYIYIRVYINRRPASVGGPPTEIERFFPLRASLTSYLALGMRLKWISYYCLAVFIVHHVPRDKRLCVSVIYISHVLRRCQTFRARLRRSGLPSRISNIRTLPYTCLCVQSVSPACIFLRRLCD